MSIQLFYEQEVETTLPFDPRETAARVADEALRQCGCPFAAQVNLLLTDEASIREINLENRGMDAVTDVLSFPMIAWNTPCDWDEELLRTQDAFYPGTDELMLGDIVICSSRMREQADAYGHSLRREFAFLTAHSMLHLCGYDHMTETEAVQMEALQNSILDALGITREITD